MSASDGNAGDFQEIPFWVRGTDGRKMAYMKKVQATFGGKRRVYKKGTSYRRGAKVQRIDGGWGGNSVQKKVKCNRRGKMERKKKGTMYRRERIVHRNKGTSFLRERAVHFSKMYCITEYKVPMGENCGF